MKLNDALRRGDPAVADSALTTEERHVIRRRLERLPFHHTPGTGSRSLRPRLAMGIGCAALLIWLAGPGNRSDSQSPPVMPMRPQARDGANLDAVRQVRFITPAGTQIVWLLRTAQ